MSTTHFFYILIRRLFNCFIPLNYYHQLWSSVYCLFRAWHSHFAIFGDILEPYWSTNSPQLGSRLPSAWLASCLTSHRICISSAFLPSAVLFITICISHDLRCISWSDLLMVLSSLSSLLWLAGQLTLLTYLFWSCLLNRAHYTKITISENLSVFAWFSHLVRVCLRNPKYFALMFVFSFYSR